MRHAPPIVLNESALRFWVAQSVMCGSSTKDAVVMLGEVATAYSVTLEIVTSAASRLDGKFTDLTENLSRRDAIIAGYMIGLTLVERAIFGGYVAQAAALVRQEIEAIAALEEIRSSTRCDGRTPNIKHVLSVPGGLYGELSRIAHFSHHGTLRNTTRFRGEIAEAPGPSEIWLLTPQLIPDVMRRLFALHTLLLLHFSEHQSVHYLDRHGIEPTQEDILAVEQAVLTLKRAGLIEDSA